MEQRIFSNWLLLAKLNKKLWSWFESFLNDTNNTTVTQQFNEV